VIFSDNTWDLTAEVLCVGSVLNSTQSSDLDGNGLPYPRSIKMTLFDGYDWCISTETLVDLCKGTRKQQQSRNSDANAPWPQDCVHVSKFFSANTSREWGFGSVSTLFDANTRLSTTQRGQTPSLVNNSTLQSTKSMRVRQTTQMKLRLLICQVQTTLEGDQSDKVVGTGS